MKSAKQIIRQEMGVALVELKFGGGAGPERVSYAVNCRHTPMIRSFEDLDLALSHFDDEITHCRKSLRPEAQHRS
jgi:hypothetical protein